MDAAWERPTRHGSLAVVSVGHRATRLAFDGGKEGSRGTWGFTPWFPGSWCLVALGVDRLGCLRQAEVSFQPACYTEPGK